MTLLGEIVTILNNNRNHEGHRPMPTEVGVMTPPSQTASGVLVENDFAREIKFIREEREKANLEISKVIDKIVKEIVTIKAEIKALKAK